MSFTILSWNILSGGFKSYEDPAKRPGRIDALVKAIKEVKPDVVSLVDTYRWTEVFNVEDLKNMFGYANAYSVKLNDKRLITKRHDNGITVFSQIPNTNMQPFWISTRNAVKTHVGGIDLFSVYFDDLSEDARLKQTKAVLKLVDPNTLTIVIGDLNTIDGHDLSQTNVRLLELAQKFPKQMKYMENVFNEMKRGEITRMFENRGFIDLGKDKGNTVPAKLFPLPVEKPIARIDYAFANRKVKLEEFKVLTDENFGKLSDHYPIWMKVSIL